MLEENHETKSLESYVETVSTVGGRLVVLDYIEASKEMQLASVGLGCTLAALHKSLCRPSSQPSLQCYSHQRQPATVSLASNQIPRDDNRLAPVFPPSLVSTVSVPWSLAVHVAMFG